MRCECPRAGACLESWRRRPLGCSLKPSCIPWVPPLLPMQAAAPAHQPPAAAGSMRPRGGAPASSCCGGGGGGTAVAAAGVRGWRRRRRRRRATLLPLRVGLQGRRFVLGLAPQVCGGSKLVCMWVGVGTGGALGGPCVGAQRLLAGTWIPGKGPTPAALPAPPTRCNCSKLMHAFRESDAPSRAPVRFAVHPHTRQVRGWGQQCGCGSMLEGKHTRTPCSPLPQLAWLPAATRSLAPAAPTGRRCSAEHRRTPRGLRPGAPTTSGTRAWSCSASAAQVGRREGRCWREQPDQP